MIYRSEIDGLRALAIVPVVLYHAGFSLLPGGFVGVDVFLVISGFLITSILVPSIERGSFSISHFYERRARRILPVFFLVTGCCLAIGWATLPPASLKELTGSAAAATLFVSNMYFWQSVNYFSSNAEFWPLIHTWSLAVEEQFYVFFPMFLMLLLPRLGLRWTRYVLLALLALSLLMCIIGSYRSPAATFYLLPTRMWEIGLGAFLAIGGLTRPDSAVLREVLASLGAALIAVAILAYRPEIPFPGWWALLAAAGTALVILCGGETRVARALSWRPVVFIGLISYSLYLWHWPVLVYARFAYGIVELPMRVILVCLVVMFALSVLSWKYVEAPFRKSWYLTRGRIFLLSGAAAVGVLAVAAASFVTGGAPHRLTPEQSEIAASIRDFRGAADCWGRDADTGMCRLGSAEAPERVLLWGDSHASALSPALNVLLNDQGLGGVLATQGACPPLPGFLRAGDAARQRSCLAYNGKILEWLRDGQHDIAHVVITARWYSYVTGTERLGEAGESFALTRTEAAPQGDNAQIVEDILRGLVTELTAAGIGVTLLDNVPEIGWNVPVTVLFRDRLGVGPPAAPIRTDVEARSVETHRIMTAISKETGARFVSLTSDLCTPVCTVMHGGRSVYADDNHLSIFGAQNVVGPLLKVRLEGLAEAQP
jgi:peptidoglycan/LPS O-acetylase OafA/YrhL